MNGTILANRDAADRTKTDFYPTPAAVTWALINYLDLMPNTVIWEPACGEGHMSAEFIKAGYGVVSSDLYDRGWGETGIDFLSAPLPECDWIITNPPFSLSEYFIKRCIDLNKPFALLLKSQYWHAAGRRKLFELHRPRAVCPLTWRPDFLFGVKSGNPTMEVYWTIWNSEPAQITEYLPLGRPAK